MNFKYAIILGIVLSVLLQGIFVPTTAGDYVGIWWFIGGQALNSSDINFRLWGKTVGTGSVLLMFPFFVRLIHPSMYKEIPGRPIIWLVLLMSFVISSCFIMFVLV